MSKYWKLFNHKSFIFNKSRGHNCFHKFIYFRALSTVDSRNAEESNENSHYFGFQPVSAAEKRIKVQSVFSNVASKYDLMNDVMSMGIHRLWKDYFIHTLAPVEGTKLLDVAGGTGDIAFRFLKAVSNNTNSEISNFTELQKKSCVTVLDMNEKMLSICKNRAKEAGVEDSLTCIQGNAEMLPFPDCSFDVYTIAFGIRNVVHIEKALAEAHRVLLPGGRFLCLEFSEVKNSSLHSLYDWYSRQILPVLGEVIAGDWKSYQYLYESIQKFPNQEDFSFMIQEAGLNCVTYENLLNGIATIHSAYKL